MIVTVCAGGLYVNGAESTVMVDAGACTVTVGAG